VRDQRSKCTRARFVRSMQNNLQIYLRTISVPREVSLRGLEGRGAIQCIHICGNHFQSHSFGLPAIVAIDVRFESLKISGRRQALLSHCDRLPGRHAGPPKSERLPSKWTQIQSKSLLRLRLRVPSHACAAPSLLPKIPTRLEHQVISLKLADFSDPPESDSGSRTSVLLRPQTVPTG
jgi:hypothetical protein